MVAAYLRLLLLFTQALNSVNNLLDSADKIYQQLSNHKQSLELSLRGVSEEASTSKVCLVSITSRTDLEWKNHYFH